MLVQAKSRVARGSDERPSTVRTRVSDEDLLKTVRRDLVSVYTDVLCKPIPDRLAATLAHLEAAVKTPARTYG